MTMKTIRVHSTEQRAARKPVSLDTSSDKRLEALQRTSRELTQARDYAQAIV
jgi:hypothetical protein